MGGATISFLNLLLEIKRIGVEPYVITNKDFETEELNDILRQNGIPNFSISIVKSVIPKASGLIGVGVFVKKHILYPIKAIKSRKEIKQIARIVKPDIIHSNTGVIHEGLWVSRKLNIPHVWHLREYQTKDFNWIIYPSYKRFCSSLLKSYVITITDDIKSYFNLNNSSKAITIYNGIFSINHTIPILEKENYFLLCSRISAEKGHADAIRAFSHFSKKESYKLIIAGFWEETYKRTLEELSDSLNCSDLIEFVGFKKDVSDIISRAKALLVPSYFEGFGRMTAEAAFCGTIVIGRNTGGTKEILNKTGGGYLFSSIEEMTEKMELVANKSFEDYKKIVEPAQKTAIDNYSIEKSAENTLAFYTRIIGAK